MSEWFGWAGSILDVDLTNMKVSREPLSRDFARKYIGGSGFGARWLYDQVGPEVDALAPEAVCYITQGPLAATAAPSGGRYDLICKAPLTGISTRTNGGGFFGPEMKWAGLDAMMVHGKAEKPVYLWINDGQAELRSAAQIWGKDVWTARRMIQEELHDPEIQTLMIGPAGENLCFSSCVISNLGRAAGKWSVGAVWGSKNLKAVAVRGSGAVKIARPKEFLEICTMMRERIKADPLYTVQSTVGSVGWVSSPILASGQRFKNMETLHHDYFAPHYDNNLACFGCGVHCSHFYRVKSGKYKGTAGEGLEGLTVLVSAAMKAGNADFVCKYNNECNKLGLHVEAPGLALAWAMDLYQAGIITKEDTGGIELTWGNEEAILQMLHMIAYKEGFGDILDGYPLRAAEKLGRGSDEWITHVKGGVDRGVSDIRRSITDALARSVATRAHDHLTGSPGVSTPNFRKEVPNETIGRLGQERYGDPDVYLKQFRPDDTKARIVYDMEHICALCDMTGTCKFVSRWSSIVEGTNLDDYARLLSAATGENFSVEEINQAAEREMLLERAYNAREGTRRIDDYPHAFHYLLKTGKKNPHYDYDLFQFTLADYDKVLDDYYRIRGCNKEGIPTRAKLESLGLSDVADDLEKRKVPVS